MTPNQAVSDGIRKFVRLTALRSDPNQIKWVRDELDLTEALEVTNYFFHETKAMLDKKMYKGQVFDFVEDVKRNVEEYLLSGREKEDVALSRKKNLAMYHLIVEPVIDLFKGIEHKQVLKVVDSVIEHVIHELYTVEVNSHFDDAIVARAQVAQMIHERSARRKEELARKRKGRGRRRKTNVERFLKEDKDVQELRF